MADRVVFGGRGTAGVVSFDAGSAGAGLVGWDASQGKYLAVGRGTARGLGDTRDLAVADYQRKARERG